MSTAQLQRKTCQVVWDVLCPSPDTVKMSQLERLPSYQAAQADKMTVAAARRRDQEAPFRYALGEGIQRGPQLNLLEAAQSMYRLSVTVDDPSNSNYLKHSLQLAIDLADALNGVIRDAHAVRLLLPSNARKILFAVPPGPFHVAVYSQINIDKTTRRFFTRGMVKFGLPDLQLNYVIEKQRRRALEILRHFTAQLTQFNPGNRAIMGRTYENHRIGFKKVGNSDHHFFPYERIELRDHDDISGTGEYADLLLHISPSDRPGPSDRKAAETRFPAATKRGGGPPPTPRSTRPRTIPLQTTKPVGADDAPALPKRHVTAPPTISARSSQGVLGASATPPSENFDGLAPSSTNWLDFDDSGTHQLETESVPGRRLPGHDQAPSSVGNLYGKAGSPTTNWLDGGDDDLSMDLDSLIDPHHDESAAFDVDQLLTDVGFNTDEPLDVGGASSPDLGSGSAAGNTSAEGRRIFYPSSSRSVFVVLQTQRAPLLAQLLEILKLKRFFLEPRDLKKSADNTFDVTFEVPGTRDTSLRLVTQNFPAATPHELLQIAVNEAQTPILQRVHSLGVVSLEGPPTPEALTQQVRLVQAFRELTQGIVYDQTGQTLWQEAERFKMGAREVLRIDTLVSVHAVPEDASPDQQVWIHTHGLERIPFANLEMFGLEAVWARQAKNFLGFLARQLLSIPEHERADLRRLTVEGEELLLIPRREYLKLIGESSLPGVDAGENHRDLRLVVADPTNKQSKVPMQMAGALRRLTQG